MKSAHDIRWFADLRSEDVGLVGRKNASLGELYSALLDEGMKVPNSFAVSAQAYRKALGRAGAQSKLAALPR